VRSSPNDTVRSTALRTAREHHGTTFEEVAAALGNTVGVVATFYSHGWAGGPTGRCRNQDSVLQTEMAVLGKINTATPLNLPAAEVHSNRRHAVSTRFSRREGGVIRANP
jgi:hypothetical protein